MNSRDLPRKPDLRAMRLMYVHADLPKYVRVRKNLAVFSGLFREVHYVGISRGTAWDGDSPVPSAQYHIAPGALTHGPGSALGVLHFVSFLRRCIHKIRPHILIATNEDYLAFVALGLLPRPPFVVCDLLDSIALRIAHPVRHLHPLWSLISRVALSQSDALVEVTEERLRRHKKKPRVTDVILNSPAFIEKVIPAINLPHPAIYVGGSLNDRINGLETLVEAIERIPHMSVVAAGRLNGSWLNKQFVAHPRVRFLGEVTPERSLAIAASCNAIFAFYDPALPNFKAAAPNKVFDAMMLGLPLIINSECDASSFPSRLGFGLSCGYKDSEALSHLLRLVCEGPDQLRRRCLHARQLFRTDYSWEAMSGRWQSLFDRLLDQR